jgi:hypothetical protein
VGFLERNFERDHLAEKSNWTKMGKKIHCAVLLKVSKDESSGGNDRFCARLKTDISASCSGLLIRGSALHVWKEVAETNLKW